jgi:hypothetical protein
LGFGRDLDHNATVGADLRLVARRAELAMLTGAIEAAKCGRGEAVLLTGEAGVGKTRLLIETQQVAEVRDVLVLKGRAIESGGAYRPLLEAFARASAPFADRKELAGVRPILARVLPGWVSDQDVLAPMADPAAVLAEALILLLRAMAAGGAVLLIDDVHWADEDTISVLRYLADSVEQGSIGVKVPRGARSGKTNGTLCRGGASVHCSTAPCQTWDHRSRDRDSAACQRRTQQR